MSIRPIIQFPHAALKSVASPVDFATADVRQMGQDLTDTLYASPGVGLAAPQIGIPQRAFAIDTSRRKGQLSHGLIVLLNPTILDSGEGRLVREGCLSIPDYTGNVQRSEWVVVEGYSATGNQVVLRCEGLEAQAVQHEMEHLDGRLFLDRLASLSTDLFRRKTS